MLQAAERRDAHAAVEWPVVTPHNIPDMLRLAAMRCETMLLPEIPGTPMVAEDDGWDMPTSSKPEKPSEETLGAGGPSPTPTIDPNVTVPATAPVADETPFGLLYVDDIIANLRGAEGRFAPNPDYITKVQIAITERMRTILIDWMFEVAYNFEFVPETFLLAVSLVDRYLSRRPATRKSLQLVGLAASLIASKIEQEEPPTVERFVDIAANTYTIAELLEMERQVLNTVQFQCNAPTTLAFLGAFQWGMAPNPPAVQSTTEYLAQASTTASTMLRFLPSTIAVSAMHLAGLVHGIPFPHCGGPVDLACVDALKETVTQLASGPQQAMVRIFGDNYYHGASSLVQQRFAEWRQ